MFPSSPFLRILSAFAVIDALPEISITLLFVFPERLRSPFAMSLLPEPETVIASSPVALSVPFTVSVPLFVTEVLPAFVSRSPTVIPAPATLRASVPVAVTLPVVVNFVVEPSRLSPLPGAVGATAMSADPMSDSPPVKFRVPLTVSLPTDSAWVTAN